MNSTRLRSGAIKGTFWKFAERLCAQLVSLLVSIVLARILVPEDYSVVSIVAIFFNFSNVIISGGFNAALIQKKDADSLDYSSVLFLTFGFSAVIYCLLFFSAGWISEIYKKELLIPVIRVMSLTLFINAYKSVLCSLVASNLEFQKFFLATIGGTVTSAIVGIIMAVKGFGAWALVAQQMTNSIIDTMLLSITTQFKPVWKVSFARLRKLFSFGGRIYLASIISVLYEEIKPLIVGIKFSPTDLAYYNKGSSFPSLLNSSISDTVAAVLFPVISKVQDDLELVKAITRRYMRTGSYVVFPLMIGFFSVAENFVVVVLTKKWLPIVPFLRIFCICYMFNIVQRGNLQAIRAIGRSDIILKLEIIKKASYIVVLFLFVIFARSPIALAVSGLVTTGIASIVNSFPNRKLIDYGFYQQIADLFPNLLLSSGMGLIVWSMNMIEINKVVLLCVQIVVGIVIYIGLSAFAHNESFKYLLNLMQQKLERK